MSMQLTDFRKNDQITGEHFAHWKCHFRALVGRTDEHIDFKECISRHFASIVITVKTAHISQAAFLVHRLCCHHTSFF